ncbi:MAG: hypothetical protein ACI9PZ_001382 [Parvicella sp.]|jgi:hypothetical protein
MNIPQGIEGKASWIAVVTSARVLGHPLVWSAMTAVFILIGYFWLQYYALPYSNELTEEGQTTLSASTETESTDIGSKVKSHWNPDIYKKVDAIKVMPITDSKDSTRARDYRRIIAVESQILPLLNNASEYMNTENYVFPVTASAWRLYSRVLELDASHRTAASGQQQIIQTLQENAELAVEKKQYENTERWLSQLDEILPGNPFQTKLRIQIVKQINEELLQAEQAQKKLEKLSRLKAALDDANLAMTTEPVKLRAAFDLYTRALEIHPENSSAVSGLKNIHLIRSDRATNAISLDDFDAAQTQIERLRETGATPQQVEALDARLQERQQILAIEQQKNVDEEMVVLLQLQNDEELSASKLRELIAATQQTLASTEATNKSNPNKNNGELRVVAAEEAIGETVSSVSNTQSQTVPQELVALFPDQVEIKEVTVNEKAKPLDLANNESKSGSETQTQTDDKSQLLDEGIANYYAGDYNGAFELLHPLAEDGLARAQFRLGIMYFQGRTVVKNQDLATQWIAQALPIVLRSAQQDIAWAQSDLGTAYEMGIGVQKDFKRSAEWYKKAAESNYAGAQTNLGVLYGTGEGVNYDRQLAVYWLKRAAKQGDKVAQDNLKILNAK